MVPIKREAPLFIIQTYLTLKLSHSASFLFCICIHSAWLQAQVCSTWQWQRRIYCPWRDRWLDTETAKVKQIGTETKETDQQSRRFAVWLLDSSVQVSWAVWARLRWPHPSREWGENSAETDFEPKSFCYKRRKIKTNLTKCIVLV